MGLVEDFSTPFDDFEDINLNIPTVDLPEVRRSFTNLGALTELHKTRAPLKTVGHYTTGLNLLTKAMQALSNRKLGMALGAQKEFELEFRNAIAENDSALKAYQLILQSRRDNFAQRNSELAQEASRRKDSITLALAQEGNNQKILDRITEFEKFNRGMEFKKQALNQDFSLSVARIRAQLQGSTPDDLIKLDRINNERLAQGDEPLLLEDYLDALRGEEVDRRPADIQSFEFFENLPEDEKEKYLAFINSGKGERTTSDLINFQALKKEIPGLTFDTYLKEYKNVNPFAQLIKKRIDEVDKVETIKPPPGAEGVSNIFSRQPTKPVEGEVGIETEGEEQLEAPTVIPPPEDEKELNDIVDQLLTQEGADKIEILKQIRQWYRETGDSMFDPEKWARKLFGGNQ